MFERLMRHEGGEMSREESLKLYSDLIKSGECWELQGAYGRTARDLIEAGIISKEGEIIE